MGRYYRGADGEELPGIALFDLMTVHPGPQAERCIGDVVAEADGMVLVGFENHGGRTYLGPEATPLARVVAGHGNNNEDRTEGVVYKNAIGTYLHGSLLPRNPVLADRLISLALARKHGDGALEPLDDALEQRAHAAAEQVALKRARRWK
jgi:CobQ-like glutamine amidotransferase family enzyme